MMPTTQSGHLQKYSGTWKPPPKSSSRERFPESNSHPLYSALLQGAKMCMDLLGSPPDIPILAKPLTPILNVQMDNAVSDNKNRYVLCFWSLIVAICIFCEVDVNFMLVDHTHDDIDALFGRWSVALRKESFSTIPLLMKSFTKNSYYPAPHPRGSGLQ